MNLKLIGFVVLLLFVVIFAVQNAGPVAIEFLFWDVEVSHALLLFVVVGMGILLGVLFGIPSGKKKETT